MTMSEPTAEAALAGVSLLGLRRPLTTHTATLVRITPGAGFAANFRSREWPDALNRLPPLGAGLDVQIDGPDVLRVRFV